MDRADATGAFRCGRCQDVGFVGDDVAGRDYVRPCECRRGLDAGDPRHRLEACRMPLRFRAWTLDRFNPRADGVRAAYQEVQAYCRRFPHSGSDAGLGLLLWGRDGLGKTALAAAVLAELVLNQGLTGRFWDFRTLVKEIGRSYDKSSLTADLAALHSALAVDVLLLDDLASQRMPDWAHNTLFEIVDARYRTRKVTLVTTPYDDVDSEAASKADALRKQEFLVERIGRRVRSRLLEMCVFVPMESTVERSRRASRGRPSTLAALRRQGKDGPS